MLNSKLEQLKAYFGITQYSDWCDVRPDWILAQDGIGPKTLDYIRVLLAVRELTLKGDRTPEYWRQHLPEAQILDTLGDVDEGTDRGMVVPFTVIIDTAEQEPFTFAGLIADSDNDYRPLIVPTERQPLGRHPDSLGDYSLSTGIGRCHVERKSMHDAHGTILGWDGRRDRFEAELANLAEMEAAMVVVECSFVELLRQAPERKNSARVNAKILQRSIIAFQQDYHVPWFFCDSRKMAENVTFRFLERFDRKQRESLKSESRAFSQRRKNELANQPKQEVLNLTDEIERQVSAL